MPYLWTQVKDPFRGSNIWFRGGPVVPSGSEVNTAVRERLPGKTLDEPRVFAPRGAGKSANPSALASVAGPF